MLHCLNTDNKMLQTVTNSYCVSCRQRKLKTIRRSVLCWHDLCLILLRITLSNSSKHQNSIGIYSRGAVLTQIMNFSNWQLTQIPPFAQHN